jgi:phosphonate degradation associated HDIG domain protein
VKDRALYEIRAAFARRGGDAYGEGVTQLEHALQAAWLAEKEGASPALLAAALLHDIGHMLHDFPDDVAEQGLDTEHEKLASAWLSQFFGMEVSEPVRLHVDAKRYLCTAEPGYWDRLSDASKLSLRLQGGPLPPPAAARFAAGPHAQAAVGLRRWDDEAKVVGLATPDLEHFLPCVAAVVRRRQPASVPG